MSQMNQRLISERIARITGRTGEREIYTYCIIELMIKRYERKKQARLSGAEIQEILEIKSFFFSNQLLSYSNTINELTKKKASE